MIVPVEQPTHPERKPFSRDWFLATFGSFTLHVLLLYGVSGIWREPLPEIPLAFEVDLAFEDESSEPELRSAEKDPSPTDHASAEPESTEKTPLRDDGREPPAAEAPVEPRSSPPSTAQPDAKVKAVAEPVDDAEAPANAVTEPNRPKAEAVAETETTGKAAVDPERPKTKPVDDAKAPPKVLQDPDRQRAKAVAETETPAKSVSDPERPKAKTADDAEPPAKALTDPVLLETEIATRPRAIHRNVPYLDKAVSPAAALAMRAVRQFESRIDREDISRVAAGAARRESAAARAVARYKRAAEKGYVMAYYNLARSLAEGRGVKRDFPAAVKNFRFAARLGNVPAMLRLADLHLAGLGVPEDRIEAQALYLVAASMGNQAAMRANALLAKHLDDNQLQQAHKRARDLRAEIATHDPSIQQDRERKLMAAAAQGDLAMVKALAGEGVDADAVDGQGRTAVVTAAWRGHHRIVQVLLDSGVEIDVSDNQGRTALSWAAINGYPEIVDKLLQEEAQVDVRDNQGMTPLIRAAWNGHEQVVTALIDASADVNAADSRGVTALRRAESQNDGKIAAKLRAAGAR
jgi:ankyrin repeat protein